MRNVSPSRFTLCFYVFLSFLFLVEITSGVYNETHRLQKTTRFRRQAERCNGFKCTATGECLDAEKRCDGTVDCQDGSDEFNDCKTAVKCPGFLFTCDYGACIEISKKCDGKKDCRDNSDEANCVDGAEKVSSNCKSDEFQCISGQCIPQDSKCNGTPDCADRSDEIKETCLNMQCPGFTFKCDYGACVDGFARCNNVKDCVDNSDEEDCGGGVSPPTPVTPTPTSKPVAPGSGCILPEHPDFGQWTIVGGASGNPSQRVGTSTILEFGCNVGYKLSSENKYVPCLGQQWSTPVMPTCLKTCPPLYTTDVTTIRCYDARNIEIKCTEATNDATATFQCAPYFEPTDRLPNTRYCTHGTWNYPAPVCQPGQPIIYNVYITVNINDNTTGTNHYVNIGFPQNITINVGSNTTSTQRKTKTAANNGIITFPDD